MGERASSALPPAALHVLLAIGPGERHGYAIMSEVERITDGSVRMGPGTLYGTIKRLLADGLIEACAAPPGNPRDDPRRRYYRLTTLGQTVAATEVKRIETLLRRSGARAWTTQGPTP
ncbi:MAG TPA: PadR family transcriptional regulator [Dehalococcoidia bacterium]|nr:PadR family transcriptional regulator [Dehalococcoidia bacterium]